MHHSHLEAVLTTLLLYALLGAAYFGWGKACIAIIASSRQNQQRTPATFLIWIGWACTLFIFQLIHFVCPLNLYSVGPVLLFGIALWVGFLIQRRRRQTEKFPAVIPTSNDAGKLTSLLVLLLLLSVWLASRSMLPATNYDSGLYHLNIIQWTTSFPITPGLGNLHGRLAFNQSFFTYVAALNLHPLFGHGRSIANSFLLLLSFMTMLDIILPAIRRPGIVLESPPLKWAPALFCLPILGYLALSSNGISSPSPDLTSSLLQLIIFVIFARLAADFMGNSEVSLGDAVILTLLSATAITIKLSNVVFCSVIMILTTVFALRRPEKRINNLFCIYIPVVLVILVYCSRGIILSGTPLYPSSIGYVNTEWSVPLEKVLEEKNWVYSWARQPHKNWKNVLGNRNWLAPWFRKMSRKFTAIVYPLGVFVTLSIIAVVSLLFFQSGSTRQTLALGAMILPLLAGLVFWFATAPNPRFANASFLLLPVSAVLLLLSCTQKAVSRTAFAAIIAVLLVVCNLNLLSWAYGNRGTFAHISLDGWQPDKHVPLDVKVTKSGLRIYTPVTGDQCWDAPLPCTPYFNENLRLIAPDDISSGFTVVPPDGFGVGPR